MDVAPTPKTNSGEMYFIVKFNIGITEFRKYKEVVPIGPLLAKSLCVAYLVSWSKKVQTFRLTVVCIIA